MAAQRKGGSSAQNPNIVAEERFDRRHEELVAFFRDMTLDEQMTHFISSITMNEEEIRLRQNVLADLIRVLKPSFPKVRLHSFGSLISGLGDKDSDLDIFVDSTGKAMNGGTSIDRDTKTSVFHRVGHILRGSRARSLPLFQDIIKIPAARIPIIKFIHRETDIHCDVSFENFLSVRNSQLIQFLIELDPRVRPLMCLLRYWGKFHRLTDSTKIKNYGLILLVLVFLERKGILPSVYKLQHWDPPPPEFKVDCWNASFYSNKGEIQNFLENEGRPPVELNEFGQPTATSIIRLAMEFFEFYENFQPDTYVICTLTGKFILRDLFTDGFEQELPEELVDYKTFCAEYPEMRRLDTSSRMSFIIQDPFSLNFNVSAVTRENILIHFLKTCKSSARHLSNFLDSVKDENAAQNMMDIFSAVECTAPTRKKPKEKRIQKKQEIARDFNQLAMNKSEPNLPPPTSSFAKIAVDFVNARLGLEQGHGSQAEKTGYEETSGNYDLQSPAASPKCPLAALPEMVFTLSPPAAYKYLFAKTFTAVPGMSSSEVIRKGKILWFLFMQDFFKAFFSKCFGLSVEIEVKEPPAEQNGKLAAAETFEKNDPMEVHSEESVPILPTADTGIKGNVRGYSNPFLATVPVSPAALPHDYPNPFTATAPITTGSKRQYSGSTSSSEAGSPTAKSLPPHTKYLKVSERVGSDGRQSSESLPSSPAREKLLSIQDELYKPFILILHCQGKATVWEGRKGTLKRIRQEARMKSTPGEPDNTLLDPMDIEEEITKKFKANPGVFRFDCQVDFVPSSKSLSIHVEVKEVLFWKPSRGLPALSSMTTMLKEMHERYVMFRLATWLRDMPPEPVQKEFKPTALHPSQPPTNSPAARPGQNQIRVTPPQTLRFYQIPPPAYQMF